MTAIIFGFIAVIGWVLAIRAEMELIRYTIRYGKMKTPERGEER